MSTQERRGRWRIGTSGWVYQHWRGDFYPATTPPARWFEFYALHFDTVEINNTFYRLASDDTFDRWREQAPPGFLYTVKANRYITHVRRLIDCAEPLERFIAAARRLGPALGPLLFQLPPRWRANSERLEGFARLLPADLGHTFEFRDTSWFNDEVLAVLRAFRLGFCIYHTPRYEVPHAVTAPLVYIRLHGPDTGSYDEPALRRWAKAIGGWCETGHDVYLYFNNDIGGHAVRNALRLKEILG